MARKGCGPYNLGAPKAIGKQLKDPKTGRTVRTEEQVEGGKMVTFTTTTPGTGGVDIEVKKKPTKTYKQFEAEGGNVEAAKAYNRAQRAKASVAPTAAQTDIKKRFIPNPISVKPESIKKYKPTFDAPKIKPLATQPIATIQAQRGTADDPLNTQRGLSGTRAGKGRSTMGEITMTSEKARNVAQGLQSVKAQVEEKYNPTNVPARVKKMGPEAVKKWQAKVSQRRSSLTPQVTTSFKMRGSAIGKKYKK